MSCTFSSSLHVDVWPVLWGWGCWWEARPSVEPTEVWAPRLLTAPHTWTGGGLWGGIPPGSGEVSAVLGLCLSLGVIIKYPYCPEARIFMTQVWLDSSVRLDRSPGLIWTWTWIWCCQAPTHVSWGWARLPWGPEVSTNPPLGCRTGCPAG